MGIFTAKDRKGREGGAAVFCREDVEARDVEVGKSSVRLMRILSPLWGLDSFWYWDPALKRWAIVVRP